jgi:hypothetical protein
MKILEIGILMIVGGIGNKDAARCFFFFLIMRETVKD